MNRIQNKLNYFKQAFDESMDAINFYLTETEDDMMAITKWILESDINPYLYIAGRGDVLIYSVEYFEGFLHKIYHALSDDGYISFPVVDGEPKIAFVWKEEKNYEQYIMSSTLREMYEDLKKEYKPEIVFLDDVYQFMKCRDEYDKKELKEMFLFYARSHKCGIETAMQFYSNHRLYDPAWIEEI